MPALRRREPGFAGLAAIVTGQQLSTASAAAIWARRQRGVRSVSITTSLRKARADRLGRLGLSAAKIKTLKNLARELAAERLNLDVLANEDADAAHNTLTALHGIGPWTADVYLLFCLGHGDAWPAGDLAVQEAVKIGLGLKTRPTAKGDGAARRAMASDARRRGASVVELLPRAEEARGRDRRARQESERRFKQVACRKTVIEQGKDPGSETCRDRANEIHRLHRRAQRSAAMQIHRDAIAGCRRACPTTALLVKVDRFAFTANNITYAVLGDELKYWQLFPAPEGFGNIPVWGFGEVIASRHPDVSRSANAVRLFSDGDASGDRGGRRQQARPARRRRASARTSRRSTTPMRASAAMPPSPDAQGDYQALLRPLFMLSFLVDDYLARA